MKTNEFLKLLQNHQDKALLFEYRPGEFVGANYHITEVKHIAVDSVDCGANSDAWNETIIQLWESPAEKFKTKHMSTLKALGILNKVGKIKAYDMASEVKIEYSNKHFHTAQLFVKDHNIQGQQLIIQLAVEKTDCKAKSDCGIVEKVQDVLVSNEPCCTPDGNCC